MHAVVTIHASPALARRQWRITGRVQGIGFRPFIFRIANDLGLSGFVRNDQRGVIVEAQGPRERLELFDRGLYTSSPPGAVVQSVEMVDLPPSPDESGFMICPSTASGVDSLAEVTPDLPICPNCLRELRDPCDRRSGYPLINCMHCGPRFSIVRGIPYDRCNTTMAGFSLCAACRQEYEQPADRRFHAQPIACLECGPRVQFVDPVGRLIKGEPIAQAARMLVQGRVVAVKGIGGFHLAVRADDEAAIQGLRRRKHRLHKPFALMCRSLEVARRIVGLSERGAALLQGPLSPILLAPRQANAPVAPSVAPGQHRLGVMLPYTPLHHLLFDALEDEIGALVMTSANDSDDPLVYDDGDAQARLGGLCDAILWHDRPIERPVDDSVMIDMGEDEPPLPLRRSRGAAPAVLHLSAGCNGSSGLCIGADLKNTIAVVRHGEVILSQHLGDLSGARSFEGLVRAVADMQALFRIRPQWVAHDLHSGYVGTRYARQLAQQLGVPAVAVQHHHAHAAAVLAEHGLAGPALAVVCDGTGWGSDGTIWGGELLLASLDRSERLGHLAPLRLPGGDAAARQPWRSALAMLHQAYGAAFADHPLIPRLASEEQTRFVCGMILRDCHCAVSSAMGRYFDGAAALIGLCSENHFEAEAPMALESAAAGCAVAPDAGALFRIIASEPLQIDLSPLTLWLAEQVMSRGASRAEMSAVFHEQVALAWGVAVERAAGRTGLRQVVLSGGVFCNARLARRVMELLRSRDLEVLRHEAVPPNDGGLSLGQAAVAARWSADRFAAKHGQER
jgi:hydrogenase maturation protein HypF